MRLDCTTDKVSKNINEDSLEMLPEDYYVQNIDFPSSYIPHQSPMRLSCVAALGGFLPPDPAEPFTLIDLGCGNGMTLNILAAANPNSQFIGVDFNSQHISEAKDFASRANIDNVEYIDENFSSLSKYDFPMADYITMNGIYSWLHQDIVQTVLNFVQSHLKNPGLFYVQTMTLPGKASIAPIWYLMRHMTQEISYPEKRAKYGLEILKNFLDYNPKYLRLNPLAKGVLSTFIEKKEEKNTLKNTIHHALSENWRPQYITHLVQEMKKAHVKYAGSSVFQDNDTQLCIANKEQQILKDTNQWIEKELLKDFILNTQNRFSVFVNENMEQDFKAAISFIVNRVFFMRRKSEAVHSISHTSDEEQFNFLVSGSPFEKIFRESPRHPMTIKQSLNGKTVLKKESFLRQILRLLASNSCFTCTTGDIQQKKGQGEEQFSSTVHALLVDQAIDSWSACHLPSTFTGDGSIALSPFESLILKAICTYEDPMRGSYIKTILNSKNAAGFPMSQYVESMTESQNINCYIDSTMKSSKFENLKKLGIISP